MTVPAEWLLPVTMLVLGSAVSFIVARYWFRRSERAKAQEQAIADAKELEARIVEIEQQLALVGQAVLPISSAFQAVLIKELTHYHTPRMDELMRKIGPPSTLTPEEEAELEAALEQRTTDMGDRITESERDAARILPIIIKRAKAEAIEAGPVTFKLVTIENVGEEKDP